MAYNLEKLLKENRDKLPEADAKAVEEAIAEARKAAEGEDSAAIRSALEKLTGASHKLAEELYKKTSGDAPGGSAPPPQGGGSPGDNVVDAEYTVKE